MPPAHGRTYYCDANYPLDCSSIGNLSRNILWALKAALTKDIMSANSGAATAWTCVGSSDGVTGALDGADRWGSTFNAAKLVRSTLGTAHSWIILRNAGLGLWLTIDYSNTVGDHACYIYLSISAPTGGGTVTNGPTSANNTPIGPQVGSGLGFFMSTAPARAWAHRVFDPSGYFLFFLSTSNRFIPTALAIWPIEEGKTSDPTPWASLWDYHATNGAFSVNNVSSAGHWRNSFSSCTVRNFANSAWAICFPSFFAGSSGQIWEANSLSAQADQQDGKFFHQSLYMNSITPNATKGKLADWFKTSVPFSGTQYPANSNTPTHISIGNVFVPFTQQLKF